MSMYLRSDIINAVSLYIGYATHIYPIVDSEKQSCVVVDKMAAASLRFQSVCEDTLD